MSAHERHERRSLALHSAVADRLAESPALVDEARRRVEGWLRDRSVARDYAEAWLKLLDGSLDELLAALRERSERMHDLRQVSPFAGVLDARTRWHILEETRQ